MTREEELRKRVEELANQHAENTRRIRELSRRNKASDMCEAWRNSHADIPGARFVNPPMFLRDGNVVNEPTADDLEKARAFEKWWETTIAPVMRMKFEDY